MLRAFGSNNAPLPQSDGAPVIRFEICFAGQAQLGPANIRLLEAIHDCRSLSKASRDLGISYRHAWLLVNRLKASFQEPLTTASKGGKGGGGMLLTKYGQSLVENYRALERDFAELASIRLSAQL
jgi:molybdate transport system regulatory protein